MQPSHTNCDIYITDGTFAPLRLRDVLFGDVWWCGGQSNMAYEMVGISNSTAEMAASLPYHNIRFMKASVVFSEGTYKDKIQWEQLNFLLPKVFLKSYLF